MAIYRTQPIPRKALWGGPRLREYFHYPNFPEDTGQTWAFSAQEGASNTILNGPAEGKTLAQLWQESPALFESRFAAFPFIVSLVVPMDDLSIQIHPNDQIAAEMGYETGKNEAWYFIEPPDSGNIVYGCTTRDEGQLRQAVQNEVWDDLWTHLPVAARDFVYLPAGMPHAMCKGSVVYEIQQATDITYRFYDYRRVDAQGNARPLHVEQAIRCMDYTLSSRDAHPEIVEQGLQNGTLTTFIQNDSFCVRRLVLRGEERLHFDGYQLMTVCRGAGTVEGMPIGIGESFLLPAGEEVSLAGDMEILMTSEE